jgi:hypothetical protein
LVDTDETSNTGCQDIVFDLGTLDIDHLPARANGNGYEFLFIPCQPTIQNYGKEQGGPIASLPLFDCRVIT